MIWLKLTFYSLLFFLLLLLLSNYDVSCEFDELRVDAHLCKLRDTSSVRF